MKEDLALSREVNDKGDIAHALFQLGEVAQHQGELAQAVPLFEESLTLRRELGTKHGIAGSLICLGDIALAQGHYQEARARLQEGLLLYREIGNKTGIAWGLRVLGEAVRVQGDSARAARLCGAEEALRESIAVSLHPSECADYDRQVAAIKAALSAEAFAAAWAAGRAMSQEEAVAYALA
jgi:tetratricopeptide (TPR) repeat protein